MAPFPARSYQPLATSTDAAVAGAFGFYDSLVVASALSAGCTRLLTEDLQHGQQIDTLTVHNPFVA